MSYASGAESGPQLEAAREFAVKNYKKAWFDLLRLTKFDKNVWYNFDDQKDRCLKGSLDITQEQLDKAEAEVYKKVRGKDYSELQTERTAALEAFRQATKAIASGTHGNGNSAPQYLHDKANDARIACWALGTDKRQIDSVEAEEIYNRDRGPQSFRSH